MSVVGVDTAKNEPSKNTGMDRPFPKSGLSVAAGRAAVARAGRENAVAFSPPAQRRTSRLRTGLRAVYCTAAGCGANFRSRAQRARILRAAAAAQAESGLVAFGTNRQSASKFLG